MIFRRIFLVGFFSVLISSCEAEMDREFVNLQQTDFQTSGGILTRFGEKFAWLDLSKGVTTFASGKGSSISGFESPTLDKERSRILFHAGSFPSSVYSVDLSDLNVVEIVSNAEEPAINGDQLYMLRRSRAERPISVLTAETNSLENVEVIGSLPFYTVSKVFPIDDFGALVTSTIGDRDVVLRGNRNVSGMWEDILREPSCLPLVVRPAGGFVFCRHLSSGSFFVLTKEGNRKASVFTRGSLVAYDEKSDIAYIIVDRGGAQEQALVHDLYALKLPDMAHKLVADKIRPFVGAIWLPEMPEAFKTH